MKNEIIIETDRLVLRPLILEDAEACFSLTRDNRVTRYMIYLTHTNIDQTIEWIKSTLEKEDELVWTINLIDENKIIGYSGIKPSTYKQDYWEIGYNLHFDYWNNGYCTEAIKALIKSVNKKLGIKNFFAYHAEENPRSGRVLEKCGFKFYNLGSYSKEDNSQTFNARSYILELD